MWWRLELLERALALAPSYQRLVESLPLKRVSLHRASAVLMMLFTERYYLGCARRCGRATTTRGLSGPGILVRSILPWLSRSAGRRALARSERHLALLRRG